MLYIPLQQLLLFSGLQIGLFYKSMETLLYFIFSIYEIHFFFSYFEPKYVLTINSIYFLFFSFFFELHSGALLCNILPTSKFPFE